MNKIDKFWKYVNIGGLTDCWDWIGPLASNKGKPEERYGSFCWNGKKYLAHQISYMLNNGLEEPIKSTLKKSCNNIKCVNPRHIYAVNREINTKEKTQLGGKLKDKVILIRKLLTEGFSCTEIANMFNVRIFSICLINKNISYKDENWKPVNLKIRKTKEEKEQILKLLLTDISQAEIAKKFKCNQSTISGIKNDELC